MRIYNLKDALAWGMKEGCLKAEKEIKAPKDHVINDVKWGPLDNSIYYCTDQGRLIHRYLDDSKDNTIRDIHKDAILSLTITDDFTMLFTCSRDTTCKLLHPKTFDEIRQFEFNYICRDAAVNPLYTADENQKFHVLLCGGQDAKDVTTSGADKGGFEMKLFNIIYNNQLASVRGHFGTVHTIAFHPDGLSFASGSEDGYVHYHRLLPEYFTKRFE